MQNRIRIVRESLSSNSRKMTQDAFSKELGVSKAAITAYETGNRVPNSAFISLICSKYGINETWLRTGEGEMHAPVSNASRRGTIYGIAINMENKYMDSFIAALEKLSDEDIEKVYKLAKNWVDENEKETDI